MYSDKKETRITPQAHHDYRGSVNILTKPIELVEDIDDDLENANDQLDKKPSVSKYNELPGFEPATYDNLNKAQKDNLYLRNESSLAKTKNTVFLVLSVVFGSSLCPLMVCIDHPTLDK